MNGEKTADLRTPQQCVMRKSKLVAYSYMLDKEGSQERESEQCSGIPKEDRDEYKREVEKCIKKEEIITPLKNVYRRLQQLANPTTIVHLIKKQANQVCISRERINICNQHQQQQHQPQQEQQVPENKRFLQGNIPAEVRPRNVQFSCVDLPSQKAFSLERRARRGDNLQVELHKLPVHFTTVEYEPILCNQHHQQQQQQQQQQQRQQQLNNQFEDQWNSNQRQGNDWNGL